LETKNPGLSYSGQKIRKVFGKNSNPRKYGRIRFSNRFMSLKIQEIWICTLLQFFLEKLSTQKYFFRRYDIVRWPEYVDKIS
jgi:hypothetical protein